MRRPGAIAPVRWLPPARSGRTPRCPRRCPPPCPRATGVVRTAAVASRCLALTLTPTRTATLTLTLTPTPTLTRTLTLTLALTPTLTLTLTPLLAADEEGGWLAAREAVATEAVAREAAVALTKVGEGATGRHPRVLRAVLRRWRRRCWLAWRRALLEA